MHIEFDQYKMLLKKNKNKCGSAWVENNNLISTKCHEAKQVRRAGCQRKHPIAANGGEVACQQHAIFVSHVYSISGTLLDRDSHPRLREYVFNVPISGFRTLRFLKIVQMVLQYSQDLFQGFNKYVFEAKTSLASTSIYSQTEKRPMPRYGI